ETSPVGREMCFVILAMLAERRFDVFLRSAQRARDALSIFPLLEARQLLEAVSREAVTGVVMALQSSEPWFHDWRTLFVRREGTPATSDDVHELSSEDSVQGWTLANVLKRSLVGVQLQGLLRAS